MRSSPALDCFFSFGCHSNAIRRLDVIDPDGSALLGLQVFWVHRVRQLLVDELIFVVLHLLRPHVLRGVVVSVVGLHWLAAATQEALRPNPKWHGKGESSRDSEGQLHEDHGQAFLPVRRSQEEPGRDGQSQRRKILDELEREHYKVCIRRYLGPPVLPEKHVFVHPVLQHDAEHSHQGYPRHHGREENAAEANLQSDCEAPRLVHDFRGEVSLPLLNLSFHLLELLG
mmetsp:Transcript_20881/g.67703  ORF Transcript_20881/g.67703 Transcript_20881/m.67703 type:complete len:228 (-) Transcript_20881:2173-2856(-)